MFAVTTHWVLFITLDSSFFAGSASSSGFRVRFSLGGLCVLLVVCFRARQTGFASFGPVVALHRVTILRLDNRFGLVVCIVYGYDGSGRRLARSSALGSGGGGVGTVATGRSVSRVAHDLYSQDMLLAGWK